VGFHFLVLQALIASVRMIPQWLFVTEIVGLGI